MANTFKKVYKKVANNGNTNDYSLVAEVGVNGVPLANMGAASASANGTPGLVPAPASGNQNKFLRGDATWQTPPDNNTTYADATTAAHGLMTAAMVTKLNGIANNANNYTYTLPAASSTVRGGITLSGSSGNCLRGDGNWITPQDTTYDTTSSIISGSSALITSGGVYTKLGLSSSENFTVNGTTYSTVKDALEAIYLIINPPLPEYVFNRPSTNIKLLSDNKGTLSSDYLPTPSSGTLYDVLSDILLDDDYRDTLIKNGDYITVKTTANSSYDLVVNLDTYYGTGDYGHIVGHHIDFIGRNLFSTVSAFRSFNYNYGTSDYNYQPFMSSDTITAFLSNESTKFSSKLRSHMITKRCKAPVKESNATTLSGSSWVDLGSNTGNLWIPFAGEMSEYIRTGSGYYESSLRLYQSLGSTAVMGEMRKSIYYSGTTGNYWWTASGSGKSKTDFICIRPDGGSGTGGNGNATNTHGVPVCFRFQ